MRLDPGDNPRPWDSSAPRRVWSEQQDCPTGSSNNRGDRQPSDAPDEPINVEAPRLAQSLSMTTDPRVPHRSSLHPGDCRTVAANTNRLSAMALARQPTHFSEHSFGPERHSHGSLDTAHRTAPINSSRAISPLKAPVLDRHVSVRVVGHSQLCRSLGGQADDTHGLLSVSAYRGR